jgi:hypothetical protein
MDFRKSQADAIEGKEKSRDLPSDSGMAPQAVGIILNGLENGGRARRFAQGPF